MSTRVLSFCAFLMLSALLGTCYGDGELSKTFYSQTCPSVETLVRGIVEEKVTAKPSMAAKLLRMHFHDCFVNGCDASILLDSTPTSPAEKAAFPNLSLGGFDVIAEIKTRVEQECAGVVSCADIVALAARDAVSILNPKASWDVFLGRRDGTVSKASDANSLNLPPGSANFTSLLDNFQRRGLNVGDLVALSGAHTIGSTHCRNIRTRLYNFTGNGDTDSSLDPDYAVTLKAICPIDGNPSTNVEMDPESPESFDGNYFKIVKENKGVFRSDAALLTDPAARMQVKIMQDAEIFYNRFRVSMMKMGSIEVLTGAEGEIRRNCSIVN